MMIPSSSNVLSAALSGLIRISQWNRSGAGMFLSMERHLESVLSKQLRQWFKVPEDLPYPLRKALEALAEASADEPEQPPRQISSSPGSATQGATSNSPEDPRRKS